MPDSLPHAEDASLYVLDLLDAEARRSFEAELESSPDLRRHVADLQANLDALALSTPAVLPPPSVWSGIAQRIAAEPAPQAAVAPTAVSAPVTIWSWIQNVLVNGWAVAAVIALAFTLHVAWDRLPAGPAPDGESDGFTLDGTDGGMRTPSGSRAPAASSLATARPAPGGANPAAVRTARAGTASGPSADDAARLQDRVRMLSEQVGMLTHMLAQRAVLPAGSAQLQVFRLVASNGLPDSSEATIADLRRTGPSGTSPQIADAGTSGNPNPTGTSSGTDNTTLASASQELPFALALAAARQFASVTTPTEGGDLGVPTENTGLVNRNAQTPPSTIAAPTTDGTASITDTLTSGTGTAPGNSIQILDLATGTGSGGVSMPVNTATDPTLVSGSDATAFGAYSPETGLGAIAFRAQSGTTEAEVYQLWMTDPHTGLVQSVGFSAVAANSQASQVVVLRFSTSPDVLSQPTFMITREPAGGSVVPTGPIVAQPPTSTVLSPNP